MKKIILSLLISSSCFSQILVVRDNVIQKRNSITGNFENEHIYDTVIVQPSWQGFKDDISISPIFLQLIPSANSNGYSTFLDYVNGGIDGKNDINRFLLYWNLMGLSLTGDQKNTINAILTKNYFAIQL